MEAGRRGRKLVAQGVVLHVDADQIVESGGRETEDPGDLLCMEEVGGLVPMDPHPAKVVAQQVVQGVAREEAQAVRDPVVVVGIVVEVRLLRPSPQFADRFGPFFVRS